MRYQRQTKEQIAWAQKKKLYWYCTNTGKIGTLIETIISQSILPFQSSDLKVQIPYVSLCIIKTNRLTQTIVITSRPIFSNYILKNLWPRNSNALECMIKGKPRNKSPNAKNIQRRTTKRIRLPYHNFPSRTRYHTGLIFGWCLGAHLWSLALCGDRHVAD